MDKWRATFLGLKKHAKPLRRSHAHGSEAAETGLARGPATYPIGNRPSSRIGLAQSLAPVPIRLRLLHSTRRFHAVEFVHIRRPCGIRHSRPMILIKTRCVLELLFCGIERKSLFGRVELERSPRNCE